MRQQFRGTSLLRPSKGAVCALVAVVALGLTPDLALASSTSVASASLLATLTNPSQQYDEFGFSVALSGTTAVVGTPGFNESSGAAYIYIGSKSQPWLKHKKVMLHDPGAYQMDDQFGAAVALSSNTLVVGAPGAQRLSVSGEVFIYSKVAGTWGTTPTTTLSVPSPGCGFGTSVSISGSTAVVGASCTNSGAGTAYIFAAAGGVWDTTPVAILSDPGATTGDDFGHSVAVSGTTVVVGADLGTSSGTAPGTAYIYTEGNGSWPTTPTVTLNDPGASQYDFFGVSVAVAGRTIAIGASGEHFAGLPWGAVYLYNESSGVWPPTPSVTLASPASYSEFGTSVSLTTTMLAVGQPINPCGPTPCDAGMAYAYADIGGVWDASPSATIAGPSQGSLLGFSVAAAGTDIAASAPSAFGPSYPRASVYIYST